MTESSLVFSIFLIFTGAAVLSTVALLTRQSMLVAYMLLGVILGPWGVSRFVHVNLVAEAAMIKNIGDIGIIFLLFLLGLHLPPQKLWQMLKKVTWVGVFSSLAFLFIGYIVAWLYGFSTVECVVVGAAMMFSSTIIGIKLLPTTILHHQHTGEVMISVLLLQDLIAIAVLLLMHGALGGHGVILNDIKLVLIGFPVIVVVAFLVEKYVLMRLFKRFDRIREYLFLVAIAWCLSLAQLATLFGLSAEIGAFVGGVTLASSPISLYIAESLKPVRDFFLVMFFFSVGASFDLSYFTTVIIPALILAAILLFVKPFVFSWLLRRVGETKEVSMEVGWRLGQISEFSLIIAYVGLDTQLIGAAAAYLIQATSILTFIVSSYYVVMRYPTPVATTDKLRRD
jgi:Kef-type K+ transport system membrane component KefB